EAFKLPAGVITGGHAYTLCYRNADNRRLYRRAARQAFCGGRSDEAKRERVFAAGYSPRRKRTPFTGKGPPHRLRAVLTPPQPAPGPRPETGTKARGAP